MIVNNHSILRSATQSDEPGKIDFMRVSDGDIQARLRVTTSPIGQLVLSQDREWLAIEEQTSTSDDASRKCDVVVRKAMGHPLRGTISDCQQLLDISNAGDVVAVIRNGAVELWDSTKSQLIKRAPFEHDRIDAAKFSPNGKLLAISDRHSLVLWHWQEETHERLDLEREVSSLAFSPDGHHLAEGPAADPNIRIRDIDTKQIVRELSTGQTLSIPHLTFAQGGRVLIACNRMQFKDPTVERQPRPRIFMWDTIDGSMAHQVLGIGPVNHFDITPNERFLIAQIDGPGGLKHTGWRLDGRDVEQADGNLAPADVIPE